MRPSPQQPVARAFACCAWVCAGLLSAGCATPVVQAPTASLQAGETPGVRAPREGLLTSGQPAASAWRTFADDGVVAVVNLRPDDELPGRDERAEVAAAGMAYHHIPVAGPGDLDDAKAATLWQLVEGAQGRVLVHCASGNRVGALLAIGAAQAGAMTPEEALAFGKSAGLASPVLEGKVRERLGLPVEAARD